MAEPPNLVLQVNVSRSILPTCIILFGACCLIYLFKCPNIPGAMFCVCMRGEPGKEASIQL